MLLFFSITAAVACKWRCKHRCKNLQKPQTNGHSQGHANRYPLIVTTHTVTLLPVPQTSKYTSTSDPRFISSTTEVHTTASHTQFTSSASSALSASSASSARSTSSASSALSANSALSASSSSTTERNLRSTPFSDIVEPVLQMSMDLDQEPDIYIGSGHGQLPQKRPQYNPGDSGNQNALLIPNPPIWF